MYTVVGPAQMRPLRVLWMLEELGQSYTHIPAMPGSDEAKSYSGTGKVPALIIGDQVFTDSVAIMTHLADAHGGVTLPAGTIDRMTQDGMTNFVLEEMDALLWTASKHSFVHPPEHRVDAIKPSVKWEFERSLDRFEQRLAGKDFLMGDQITIPDIVAVHCLNWAHVAKFPPASPALIAYSKRLRARPAYIAATSNA
ncbi:MAG: glutathione S-transferase family protein [Planktomarina sp.]